MAYGQMRSTVMMNLRRCFRCKRKALLPVLVLMTGTLIYIFEFIYGFETLWPAVRQFGGNLVVMNRSVTPGDIIYGENKLTKAMSAVRPANTGGSESPPSTSFKEDSLTAVPQHLGPHQNATSDFVMVWSHYATIPQTFMDKIETFLQLNPGKRVVFLCGSSECIDQIDANSWKHVTVFRLLLFELTQDTPLDDFVSKSAILKLIMGRKFMAVVHEISVLLALWRYGGLYIDIRRIVPSNLPDEYLTGQWMSTEGIFFVSRFERHSLFVKSAMVEIQLAYSSLSRSEVQNWDTDSVLLKSKVLSQVDKRQIEKGGTDSVIPFLQDELFGILSFDHRVKVARDINVGDEIQTLAGLQFLPFVDLFVDRDTWDLTKVVKSLAQKENTDNFGEENTNRESHGKATNWSLYMTRNTSGNDISKTSDTNDQSRRGSFVSNETNNLKEAITMFLNGWYNAGNMIWPPKVNLNPLILSMYFGSGFWRKLLTEPGRNYLQNHGPVGARDEGTLNFLKTQNFSVYKSGCLTLLMRNPNPTIKREDIFVVDVNKRALELIVPYQIRKSAINVTHNLPSSKKFDRLTRYEAANSLMERYSRAKLVITSRIHCALPCVAMGIPVVFVETDVLPGGGGRRTEGLTELFHTVTVDPTMKTYRGLENFNWDKPEMNPNREIYMRFRATLWYEIRKSRSLRETAITFGVIPFTAFRQLNKNKTTESVFFQVYTTKNQTKRNRRSLESIFYHHPNAKVRIQSNALTQKAFSEFNEAGFQVEVENYTLENLLRRIENLEPDIYAGLSKAFLKRMPVISKGPYWYSHETDLIRLILLYLYGGVYMDTDVILVKSLKVLNNVTAWENRRNSVLNGAVVKFDKHNPFLRECIKEYLLRYNKNNWAANGPHLLTRVARNHTTWVCDVNSFEDVMKNESCIIRRMYRQSFYPIEYQSVIGKCFLDKGKVNEESFAVHLYNKVSKAYGNATKPGTLCRYILNNFCIFCGDFV